ncbi:hypothetical protein HF925_08570 [Acidithiobacillus ferriphilus]|uniref:hypothetical protein n=1 Tax=Acidithiobacillus ferriphilus TaxID=1689834 RepID=UPI001C07E587|nr:hypothetical protein [Acidithiobacillus ferriphilus]MBU2848631.1 hypothetical protein [Acidithiobacillus ferriphilus]
MESSDTESNTSHEAKSGSSVSPFYLTSAEIKSQQKEMYAVAKERSLSPRRCIVYRVDETIPWDFWEKNRAERKIKEGGMISSRCLKVLVFGALIPANPLVAWFSEDLPSAEIFSSIKRPQTQYWCGLQSNHQHL